MVSDFFITESDKRSTVSFVECLRENRVEGRVDRVVNVLDEHRVSVGYLRLDDVQELRIAELQNLQFVRSFHVLYPLICLQLWIDEKWPSVTFSDEDGVLLRYLIRWKSLHDPLS